MKKSILALSAAAVVGGLGFAGSAQALGYIGPGLAVGNSNATNAVGAEFAPGGVGHFLFVPYFSAQGNNATLLNITNTDMQHGKVVKVRFRGAANSDDILDFTLFMSPGDMWTGMVYKDPASGYSKLESKDKSCSIPAFSGTGGQDPTFRDDRLPAYLSGEALAAQTREGYIEILNMADIWADPAAGSLYTNTKHVNGVAPCNYNATVFQNMLDGTWWDTTAKIAALQATPNDLAGASGMLMASWAIVNQDTFATWSGSATAVAAVDALTPPNNYAIGNIMMTPQIEVPLPGGVGDAKKFTADPLLRGGWVSPLWFDLPDMSTPIGNPAAGGNPLLQAASLSTQIGHVQVTNEYFLTEAGTVMNTDWVISQPTRRYFAAVQYGASANAAKLWWNPDIDSAQTITSEPTLTKPATADNRYNLLNLSGDKACMAVGFSSASREEQFSAAVGQWSPGQSKPTCGEVLTLSFSSTSPLGATLTNTVVTPASTVGGWGTITVGGNAARPLPVVGFSATLSVNGKTTGNLGTTLPHRWWY